MKIRKVYILIFILALCIIVLLYKVIDCTRTVSSKDKLIEELRGSNDEKSYIIENGTIIAKLQYHGEDKSLENVPIYSENGDSILLSDRIGDKEKLVVFFSEQSCSSCYLPFLEKLNSISSEIGKENIIIIGKFSMNRNYRSFVHDNPMDFPIYRIKEDLHLYPEYNDYAMAFITTKEMIVNKLIIIDKSNILVTNEYLNLIQAKYEI